MTLPYLPPSPLPSRHIPDRYSHQRLIQRSSPVWYHRRKSANGSEPGSFDPARDGFLDAIFSPNYTEREGSSLPATSQLQSMDDPAAWREQYSAASPRELEGREIQLLPPASPSPQRPNNPLQAADVALVRGSVAGATMSSLTGSQARMSSVLLVGSAGSRATVSSACRPESVEISPAGEGEDSWKTGMSEVPRRKSVPKAARVPSEYTAELPG